MVTIHNREKILIIEDEAEISNFTSRVLELEGYQVLQANDAVNGINIAAREKVSLVIIDSCLPERDSCSLLTRIKGESELSTIPVVILSASAGKQPRKKALNLGAADYLLKPLSAARLRNTIHQIISRKKKIKYHAN